AYHAFAARHRDHPNDFQPLHYLAYVFRLCNLVDRALAAERLAIERDPSVLWSYRSSFRLLADNRRDAEAAVLLEQAQVRFPDLVMTRLFPLALLLNQERFAEIVEEAPKISQSADDPQARFKWAYALIRLGRPDEARSHVAILEPFARVDMDFAASQAALLGWLGERDAAFGHLARAAELGNDSVYIYEREDLYGPLHGDPRWAPFLAARRERAESYRDELRWPIDLDATEGGR
ncbi:MAG: hypothetical protein ABIP29_11060, partial [Candidatus Eisenbacteria bacterium]